MLRSLKFTVDEDYVDENIVNLHMNDSKHGISVTLNIDVVGMKENEIMDKLSRIANGPNPILSMKGGRIL
jgi:hypothetical protein